jgi:hypothetical protein
VVTHGGLTVTYSGVQYALVATTSAGTVIDVAEGQTPPPGAQRYGTVPTQYIVMNPSLARPTQPGEPTRPVSGGPDVDRLLQYSQPASIPTPTTQAEAYQTALRLLQLISDARVHGNQALAQTYESKLEGIYRRFGFRLGAPGIAISPAPTVTQNPTPPRQQQTTTPTTGDRGGGGGGTGGTLSPPTIYQGGDISTIPNPGGLPTLSRPAVGSNVPTLSGPTLRTYAAGGRVPGSGGEDSVLARVSPGELIVPPEDVQSVLDALAGRRGDGQPLIVIHAPVHVEVHVPPVSLSRIEAQQIVTQLGPALQEHLNRLQLTIPATAIRR